MKTLQSDARPTQHQPVAERGEKAPLPSVHAVAASPHHTLQGVIDQSPRVQAQRRTMQAAFGNALQRRSAGLDDDRFAGVPAAVPQARAEPGSEACASPNQTGMPASLKTGIESLSGMDMSDVRVHRNSSQPAQLNALAYAQGNDIHLGPGQEQHLPHEAWHVVQQRQGRVHATMQMAGVGVNDDLGLESEADAMGEKALQSASGDKRHNQPPSIARRNVAQPGPARSAAPVQAVMSVADFEAATPGSITQPRRAVTAIDVALGAYVAARTFANANALIGVLNTYIGGNHDAGRKQVATALRSRATMERDVLQHIGNGASYLVDALIDQVGAANVPALIQLATDAAAVNAPALPALIVAAGGGAGLANLNAAGLVTAMGAAHVPLLATMINNIGGMAERVRLFGIVNRHAGQGNLALDFTQATGAVDFARLADEVPLFQQVAAPGVPLAGELAAIAVYNLALQAGISVVIAPLFAQMHADMLAAHVIGTGAGAAVGLLGQLAARTVTVNVRQGINAGGGPAAPADINAANQANGIVFALDQALTNAGAAPAVLNALAPLVASVLAGQLAIQAAFQVRTIQDADHDHFLTRHTPHHFDFSNIDAANTQWDPAWGAGAPGQVGANFVAVLTGLPGAGLWLQPGVPIPNRAGVGGAAATIAARGAGGGNQISVGQFFPHHNPGAQIHDHSEALMRAIRKVL
jgi:hypothetical protein